VLLESKFFLKNEIFILTLSGATSVVFNWQGITEKVSVSYFQLTRRVSHTVWHEKNHQNKSPLVGTREKSQKGQSFVLKVRRTEKNTPFPTSHITCEKSHRRKFRLQKSLKSFSHVHFSPGFLLQINSEPLRDHIKGSWVQVVDKTTKCLNRLLELGFSRRRNYILDQVRKRGEGRNFNYENASHKYLSPIIKPRWILYT
jgi:hypothetical protein